MMAGPGVRVLRRLSSRCLVGFQTSRSHWRVSSPRGPLPKDNGGCSDSHRALPRVTLHGCLLGTKHNPSHVLRLVSVVHHPQLANYHPSSPRPSS